MGYGIDGIGADLMDVFSHRRDVINEKVAAELVPGFLAEYGRARNQRELASLMDKANLRTRKGKDGVIDWDETTRGWQAKAPAPLELAFSKRQAPCHTHERVTFTYGLYNCLQRFVDDELAQLPRRKQPQPDNIERLLGLA
jgi:TrwC relaxase